jgi:hypothetical protein
MNPLSRADKTFPSIKIDQTKVLDRKIASLMTCIPSRESLSTVENSKKMDRHVYNRSTGSYIKRMKGHEEQAAVAKMWEMKQMLSDTHYLFSHGLSGSIAILHDLISLADRADVAFPCRTPIYKKRFRLPCETTPYTNAEEYLRLSHQNDHNELHRELILSSDAFLFQDAWGESALNFFRDNNSVCLKTEKEPGNTFVERTLEKFLDQITTSPSFKALIQKSVKEFMEISPFANLSTDWNQLNLIAIPKETLNDPDVNYAYRSHEWGISCDKSRGHMDEPYTNEKKLENHKAFISLLEKHNSLDPSYKVTHGVKSRFKDKERKPSARPRFTLPPELCMEDAPQPDSPVCCKEMIAQYRLLAHNLDKDPMARIFTFNKYTADEKKQYLEQIAPIVHLIKTLVRLESIDDKTTNLQLESILLRLDLDGVLPGHRDHECYLEGIKEVLSRKASFLDKHKDYLMERLPTKNNELLDPNCYPKL